MVVWASPYLTAHAAYLRHLARAPESEVFDHGGVWAVRTRVLSNTENGVLSGEGAHVTRDVVQRLTEWFAAAGVPASWICAEGAGRLRTAAVLEAAGWKPERNAYEMRAPVAALVQSAASQEAVRIERVTSVHRLDEWLDVAAACGWFETDAEREAMRALHFGASLAPAGPLRLYLARRHENPVGMAAAFHAGTTALLIAVAVLSSARRSGIGSTLAR